MCVSRVSTEMKLFLNDDDGGTYLSLPASEAVRKVSRLKYNLTRFLLPRSTLTIRSEILAASRYVPVRKLIDFWSRLIGVALY